VGGMLPTLFKRAFLSNKRPITQRSPLYDYFGFAVAVVLCDQTVTRFGLHSTQFRHRHFPMF
jgi:hypothetical protein